MLTYCDQLRQPASCREGRVQGFEQHDALACAHMRHSTTSHEERECSHTSVRAAEDRDRFEGTRRHDQANGRRCWLAGLSKLFHSFIRLLRAVRPILL